MRFAAEVDRLLALGAPRLDDLPIGELVVLPDPGAMNSTALTSSSNEMAARGGMARAWDVTHGCTPDIGRRGAGLVRAAYSGDASYSDGSWSPDRGVLASRYRLAVPPATPANLAPLERSTIEHVASAAGVSVATVSRALRGLPNVAVSTRARVEEAARALNYRADPAASRLAAGRSRTIAIVVPLINSWYFANVVAGAEAVCAEEGYDLLILTAPDPAARRKVVTTAHALDRRVDGLIFVEVAVTNNDVADLARRRLEVVTVGHQTDLCSSVCSDNVGIGRIAVEHLVGLGHRRIGILGGQAEEPDYVDVPGQRIQGAEDALSAAGLALDRERIAPGGFTVEGGHKGALELLARDRPADRDLRPLRRDGVRGARSQHASSTSTSPLTSRSSASTITTSRSCWG